MANPHRSQAMPAWVLYYCEYALQWFMFQMLNEISFSKLGFEICKEPRSKQQRSPTVSQISDGLAIVRCFTEKVLYVCAHRPWCAFCISANNGRYRFLSVKSYPEKEADRVLILAHFNAPPVLASKMCTEINGYFGSRSSYGEDDKLKGYSKPLFSL